MTMQQARDYKTIEIIWHMFRDFGDITNTDKDEDRWQDLIDLVDEGAGRYSEHRALFSNALNIIYMRAAGPEAANYTF